MRLDPRTARVVGLAAVSDVVLGGVLLVLGVVVLLRDRPGSPSSPGSP